MAIKDCKFFIAIQALRFKKSLFSMTYKNGLNLYVIIPIRVEEEDFNEI